MSNPQLSSNAASALLATINESPNTQHNSYVYSETDAIVPQTSMQWDNLIASSGSSKSSQSLHFDINKNGYMTKMVLGLRWLAYTTLGSTTTLAANFALNSISEITVSSGGRVIQRHTRETLFAHISECPDYVKGGYVQGAILDSAATAVANVSTVATADTHDFFLNIPGFWEKNKTSLNTSFLQPLRVTVRFANFAENCKETTTHLELDDDNSALYVQYRNMQDPVDAATIQSNYGDGLLSQLITTWSQENPFKYTSVGTASVEVPAFNLKETSCVESMYIMMMANNLAGATAHGANYGQPLELENIQFRSNGNSYVDVPAKLLMFYGTQSTHGSKGFGSTNYTDTNSIETGGTKYVYKIDFGQGDTDRNELTNLLSFRELANPQVIVKWTPKVTGTDYYCHVVYKRSELSNTVSSNGKYAIALSN
jgi:hypothetical protein